MIDLFRGTYFEAMNMKGLLESNNIEVFTINENMSNIQPWVVTVGGFNSVILKVNDEDLERAKEIVEDYQRRI